MGMDGKSADTSLPDTPGLIIRAGCMSGYGWNYGMCRYEIGKRRLPIPTLSEYANGFRETQIGVSINIFFLGVWKMNNEHPGLFQDIHGSMIPDNINHRVSVYIISQVFF